MLKKQILIIINEKQKLIILVLASVLNQNIRQFILYIYNKDYIIIVKQISTMPRTTASRQKNKPFKAKSKGELDRKKSKASTKTKAIVKPKGRSKSSRLQLLNQSKEKKKLQLEKITVKNDHLDEMTKSVLIQQMKSESEMKIIVLVPGNKDTNTNVLINQIYQAFKNLEELSLKIDFIGIPYPTLQIIPKKKTFIKNKLTIISGQPHNRFNSQITSQNLQSLLDLIKCADIICPVLSCKSTNIQQMQLDPHEKGGAFDDFGYTIVNMIRSIGTPTTIGVVQDLNCHQMKHHDKIQRLFKRFLDSQLGEHDKINYLKGNQGELNKLLRQMDTTTQSQQVWKNQRGYILVEQITTDQNSGNVTFHGYLKGNSVHSNQLVHITGFEDYEIEKIEIKQRNHLSQNLVQYSTNPESLYPFSKTEEISDDILSGLNNLQLGEKKIQNQMGQEQGNDSGFEDQSDDQNNQDIDEYFGNQKQQQKTKRIQMHLRNEDELQFDDQAQYGADQILREKFKDFQGLKNFKTSEWNELENLPDVYDRIYTFKNYHKIHQTVKHENQSKGFAYPNFYISVTVKGFPQGSIQQHVSKYPTILTFLLKHERKMTQLHLKVKRNPYYLNNETVIESNQHYSICLGFRRILVRPIFSKVIPGTQKTKYAKKIEEDYQSYFYCSFYYFNYFPPAPVQIYRVNQLNFHDKQASPIMYGTLAKCDPLHIILERIILTGYPFKINKRRSTIRFMFFNPKDVKYFKPVQVRSKMGLKGRIQQSLGTHGYMKVLFNDKIKHNDTVCMYLYRRIFPEPNF